MQEQYDDALWQAAFPKSDWYLDMIPQFKCLEDLALQEPDYDVPLIQWHASLGNCEALSMIVYRHTLARGLEK